MSNSLKTTLETFNLKIKKENRINNEEEQKQPLSEKINRIPKNKTLIKESINPPISIENPKSQLDNSKQVKNEKSREPLKKTKGDNLEEEKHYKKPANFINFKEEFKIL